MTLCVKGRMVRAGLRALGVLTLAAAVAPAWAKTDIELWHVLQGHNKSVFEDLVKSYNRSQSDVNVKLQSFMTPEGLDHALDAAAKSKELPALAQLGGVHTAEEIAARAYVRPFYAVQNAAGLKKVHWFVSSDNAVIHDARGRLLAFPAMLDVPVMYFNRDAFGKAGLNPVEPKRTWIDLQGQLVSMANRGSRQCPIATDLPVSINLENLAAVNNQLYASADNGLKAKGLPSFSFDATYVRHLALMISWVRSHIMVRPGSRENPVEDFAQGHCAILLSASSHLGTFAGERDLNYGVSGLPYYPEVTSKPGNPFVGGDGLWVMKQPKAETDATVSFLSWLAQTPQSAKWYQETGFLPVTKAAFDETPKDYYSTLGHWRDLVAVYARPAAVTGRGFRIHNYPAVRARFREILTKALHGEESAVTALNHAAKEGNALVRQR